MSFSWGSPKKLILWQDRRAVVYPAFHKKYPSFMVDWHSLQVQAPRIRCKGLSHIRKRISLLTSKRMLKASLTVEAALAMTVFLLVVTALLNFFFVLRTQIQVQTALEQTGNQLAALPEEASLLTASLVFQGHLATSNTNADLVVGGAEGISLARSTVMGHEPVIDLVAVYRMRLPFFPEGTVELNLVQRSRKHAFGAANFGSSETVDYVYITPQGEVCHESMYCTYLRPKTEEVKFSLVSQLRNQNGSRYEACEFCCDEKGADTVWITQWGESYHVSAYCRGLWHQVEQVKRSEVADRRMCSKCGKTEE